MPHSDPMQNPTGGVWVRRAAMQPALRDDLMTRVLDRTNMQRAWKQVKANGGAAGVDGMTIDEFPAFVRAQWSTIRQALEDGTYQPAPVRQHGIPKLGDGERLLGIPRILDRVIQQAISQVLTPIFDPNFSESSFGFRPRRSAHGAVKQVQGYLKAGYRYCVDLDLAKFFDTVDHDVLMARVAEKVSDKRLLKLIGRYLRAGVMVEGTIQPTPQGTPQGAPLSPLLSNIVLDMLDKELEKRGHRFARYADDVVILVRSRRAGERVMQSITRFLERKLKLKVNRQKSQVVSANEVAFLGFVFRRGKIRWSEQSLERFKAKVRRLTSRTWGVSMKKRLAILSCYVRGWINYYGLSNYYRPLPELDRWIRRRIRMCFSMAVGPSAPSNRDVDQARGEPARCDHHGPQQSRFVDDGAYAGDPTGDVELVVESAGACLSTSVMDRACSATMNRPVRTRMQGGVGAGRENLPATRLYSPV